MIDHPLDHADDELSHLDPDDVLIVDYLARALSPAEAAAVEARLRNDSAFFEKAAPHIRLWTSPVKYRPMIEALERARPVSQGILPFASIKFDGAFWKNARSWAVTTGLCAAAMLMLVLSGVHWYGNWATATAPPAVVIGPQTEDGRQKAEESGLKAPPFVVLTLPPTAIKPVVPSLPKPMFAPLQPVPITPSETIPHVRISPWIDSVPHKLRRLLGDTTIVTEVAESLFVTMENATRLTVRSDTRFRWTHSIPGYITGTLEGEIAIDVSPNVKLMRISTSVGSVQLKPGSYAIRCALGCDELLLTVRSGVAQLPDPDPVRKQSIEVDAGFFARIPRGGPPERTDGGNQYPKPIPADSTGRGSNQ